MPKSDSSNPPQEIAAEYLSVAVPTATPHETVAQISQSMIGERFETAAHVAVVESGRLVGLIGIEDLLAASPSDTATEIMDVDPPCIGPGADQEEAARRAAEHGPRGLAVVDTDHRFLGLIPPYRMLGVLLREHGEDLARLGGYLHQTDSARAASEEPVHRRFWHRLPWLLLGLLGATLAAGIVGSFESQLEKNLTLAFFIPGVVYMADAVGTQTETLMIRGLSVGVPIRSVVRRELVTGVLIGVAVAVAFLPAGLLLWDDGSVAVAVAVALMAACSTATIVAMLLPAAFAKLGVDPAFGSGPVATVVQDLLSILIYFAVASIVVS